MSLTYCELCQQLEGDTYLNPDDEQCCETCDEPVKHVLEHDDYDMER